MEAVIISYCCGCLSTGRKMKTLNSFWTDEAFLKIFSEIPIQTDAYTLLCWECEARIFNFIKFKAQIKKSWKVLQDYAKEYHKPSLQSVSKLTIFTQENFNNFTPIENQTLKDAVELKVKVEDDYSTHCDDNDDDTSMLDVVNESDGTKKKSKKGRRAKVKKKNEQAVLFEEIVLTKEEVLEERLMLSSKEEYVNAMFKCEKCIMPFANQDDLTDHEQRKHSFVSKYTCEYCERAFPSNRPLSGHARRHTARWRCAGCPHRARTAAAALAHYTASHARGELFDLAAKAFGNYGEEKTENKKDDLCPPSQLACPMCGKCFRWKASLRKHTELHAIEAGHTRRPFCEPCAMVFTSSANLRKHVKTSSKHQIQLKLRKLKENPPLDSDPNKQANEIENIKSSINTQKEQFPCPQCEKKFQWKGNLWRHLQSHAARANGELVCKPCNRTFSSIATYQQHMKISRKHVTEEQFKYMCSDCGKRFCNKSKLRDHIDWDHLKRYTHTCTECQKVFKSHTSLYLHKQVVHKLCNAQHLCDHCGKSFPNKTKLRCHIRALHTRESSYACGSCSARFRWDSCLSRHTRRVHRNKPQDPAAPT